MPSATALRLMMSARRRVRRRDLRLPALLAFTDPARTPDPLDLACALPRGAGLVYRAFGAADARSVGLKLAAICRRRGVLFLVGADAALARAVKADGVHLPERTARPIRRRRPRGWIVTVAAHAPKGLLRAARIGADAAVLSPIFPSRSPSAAQPIGPWRAGCWARWARLPVYALGGINGRTVRRLPIGAFSGVAAIDGVVRT
ncbi:MAG: thiamine phosphate synthase [Caulobacterales bacterium]